MTMNALWTKNLKGDEKKKRQDEIKSYTSAFQALEEILEEESSTPKYDSPSWAYEQADQNGYNRAIRMVKTLIKLKEED